MRYWQPHFWLRAALGAKNCKYLSLKNNLLHENVMISPVTFSVFIFDFSYFLRQQLEDKLWHVKKGVLTFAAV